MLSGTPKLMAGYAALHDQEARNTAIALEKQSEFVAVWYRYLTLMDRALRGEHESVAAIPSADHDSWELRLRLLGTATASAKLCLDAALAGYYSQAFGLIRHMLETWKIMAYVRLVPQAAINWYPRNGVPAQEPVPTTADKGIRTKGDAQTKHNLSPVLGYIKRCDKGAHPSALALAQVETGHTQFLQMGATYVEQLAVEVMSLGTVSLALILDEVTQVVKVDSAWKEELDSATTARNLCQE